VSLACQLCVLLAASAIARCSDFLSELVHASPQLLFESALILTRHTFLHAC
jgi:hypothetical protein